ncbi:hypothetical protein HMPREF1556_01029 [Porphyromonas sp. oral taxon 278 str. W7784]|nr:hypothetical protein HMPREF1556_01029 [Porphyromonas sp. oral taxon 278 str. W7784]
MGSRADFFLPPRCRRSTLSGWEKERSIIAPCSHPFMGRSGDP